MARFSPIVLVALIAALAGFSTSANAEMAPKPRTDREVPAPVVETAPQLTGSGPIADFCKTKFVRRSARTACEVKIRLDLEQDAELQRVNETIGFLIYMVDELHNRAGEQDKRILELQRQLAAVEE